MMIEAFIHGVLLALGLILPLGVQNVFIFNQGGSQPALKKAFPSVITASVCDTVLILTSVLGLSILLLQVPFLKTVLYGCGIIFLAYMGWTIWQTKQQENEKTESLSSKKQISFALSVSLLNPHALLDTVGVIGSNSLLYSGETKIWFTLAAILVSWVWFFFLAFAGRFVQTIDSSGKTVYLLNKSAALIIWGIVIYMIIHSF